MLALFFTQAGCSVDTDLVHGPLEFSCYTANDCLDGYECIGATAEQTGVCRSYGGSDLGDCQDRDGDTCWVGEGCGQGLCRDCDDDNPLINPNQDESCNGIDDNCNTDIDEDVGTNPCPLQMGVCAGARAACVEGAWQDCAANGLYGGSFEDVDDIDETCDGLDNNCRGGYPADATPEEIDAHCDCIPGYTGTTACGEETGECERGIKFCDENGDFTECVVAELGDTCTNDGDCGTGSYCVDEQLDFKEDFLDDCQINSQPDCQRRICRELVGTTACTAGGTECTADEACVDGFCQLVVQSEVPESCNGRDDDCNGYIDEGEVCATCPYGMILIEGVPGIPSRICMDKYEASHPDATSSDTGSNDLYSVSVPGVVPWTGVDTAQADAACKGTAIDDILSGAVPRRRLCLGPELAYACDGNSGTYPYGSNFTLGSCADASTGTDLAPSGSFSSCCVQVGATEADSICDLSGNAAELVTSPFAGVFGGSTATQEAADLICDAVPTASGPSVEYRGFRCCSVPYN